MGRGLTGGREGKFNYFFDPTNRSGCGVSALLINFIWRYQLVVQLVKHRRRAIVWDYMSSFSRKNKFRVINIFSGWFFCVRTSKKSLFLSHESNGIGKGNDKAAPQAIFRILCTNFKNKHQFRVIKFNDVFCRYFQDDLFVCKHRKSSCFKSRVKRYWNMK